VELVRSPRRLALAFLTLAAAATGCGSKSPAVTGVVVLVTMKSVTADQLSFSVTTATGDVAVSPQTRPATANGPLASTQSVSIFLPDDLAGTVVTATVTPLKDTHPSGAPASNSVTLVRQQLVDLPIVLDQGLEDGGGAGGTETDGSAGSSVGGAGGQSGGGGGAAGGSPDGGAGASEAGVDGPIAKALGQPCGNNGECDSMLCVDGVCCESPCVGACRICNMRGKEGTCMNVSTDTTSPRTSGETCADQGQSQCSFNGRCDGNGNCQLYAAGVTCKAASCNGASWVRASACDGTGKCIAPNAVDCTPYYCAVDAGVPGCLSTCAATTDCVNPAVCAGNSCGMRPKKDIAAGCTADGDCTSGHCADGVCCMGTCTASCMACNVPGSEGTCVAVPQGNADPRSVCKDAGITTCGKDGMCNGAGGCELYPNGTTCAAGSCKNSTLHPAHLCDGKGMCITPSDVDCGNYKCDPVKTACYTSCSIAALQCTMRRSCDNGVCTPQQ
jgi:hypothetical protein